MTQTARVCWRCKREKEAAWNYCAWCSARLQETRTPLPPNRQTDMEFLRDLYSYGWYAHHAAHISLYESLASPDVLCGEGRPEPHRSILELPRLQKIFRAQMFAEFVALMEAFGMLCVSIRRRCQKSILWSYLNAEPGEVDQFYEYLLQGPQAASFAEALKLPSENTIATATNVSPAERDDFATKSNNLRLVAEIYRDRGRLVQRAYNKIKHGFVLSEAGFLSQPLGRPEDVAMIVELPAAWSDQGVGFFRLPMTQAGIDGEIENVHRLTSLGAEIIALAIMLDEQGLLY